MCGSMSPFRHFFSHVKPIVMLEPLAETLGCFDHHQSFLEFSFDDVVKMAGHACPTVASAFVCCRTALAHLHPRQIPERGNIAVTIGGTVEAAANGVVGDVIGYVTGARGATGFKGLGGKFGRKDLLTYDAASAAPDGLCILFKRLDKGQRVKATIRPARFPAVPGQERLPDLLARALAPEPAPQDLKDFQTLWMERVKAIVLDERDLDAWLTVEPA